MQAQPDSAPSSSCPLQHAPSPQEHMAQTRAQLTQLHPAGQAWGSWTKGSPEQERLEAQVAGTSPEPHSGG